MLVDKYSQNFGSDNSESKENTSNRSLYTILMTESERKFNESSVVNELRKWILNIYKCIYGCFRS